ncbi:MAG: acetyl ornithine aminotransferase family protein [Planctomycetaceae bacterium]|nr:acetyl ornithine aminotransferase family protein [Planctomycetaceae bacterium]
MLMRDHQRDVPYIATQLPGPIASKLIALDERYTSPSYTRAYPLAVAKGEGAVIEDVDGNRFLDFNAGIAVCATGHCHPRVVKAIQEQASRLIHMSGTDFYYGPQAELARRLAELAPGASSKRVFFTNSGTEAVEAAFKLARYHTKRKHMIAFYGAFHGRTMGALSLTASKVTQRAGFAPLIPQVSHVEFPNSYRYPLRSGNSGTNTFDQIENELFKRMVAPDEVAAIIVEPIQGEGGYIVPPPEFHRRLKALAERHGILLIADEIQSGMGRTGKMFAMEHWGVEPDIICLAKGLASGMPLGAIITRDETMDWPPGSHASTFGGNPVSCAAALTTINLLEEGLIANAADVGAYLIERLSELQSRHRLIGDVRGKGLMIGIELVRNRDTKEPAVVERNAIVQECFQKGLLLLGCGTSAIRFCPPLVIDHDDVDTAVDILDEVLSELPPARRAI